eukprot:11726108-Karenia_brevis.AAC.1
MACNSFGPSTSKGAGGAWLVNVPKVAKPDGPPLIPPRLADPTAPPENRPPEPPMPVIANMHFSFRPQHVQSHNRG